MHLILGSSIQALEACRDTESNLYLTFDDPPHVFEECHDYWNELVFKLSLEGKLKGRNKVKSLKLNSDSASILFSDNTEIKSEFSTCEVYNYSGLDVQCSRLENYETRYLVYDWFNVASMSQVPAGVRYDFDTEFLNAVRFYKNGKVICKSRLTGEQIQNIEYSDVYCRFELIKKLKDMGFRGRKNGKTHHGEQKYLNLDLLSTRRDVISLVVASYLDTKKIKFYDTRRQ